MTWSGDGLVAREHILRRHRLGDEDVPTPRFALSGTLAPKQFCRMRNRRDGYAGRVCKIFEHAPVLPIRGSHKGFS